MVEADYALFADIVARGSLSAAARHAALSPAMVSKRLARLERRLGARLVHRTTRRLTLTPVGERFHADVVAILEQVRRAEDRVAGSTREARGSLRVSMPTSFGRLHVAHRLPRFLDRHPAVRLEVNLSDLFVDLMAERIDVAVRITAEVPRTLAAHRLATSRRILCASPDYLARHGQPRTVADLSGHRLLAANGQMPWRLVHGERRMALDRPSHVATNSSEMIRELAIAGAGIALRSLWDVGAALRDCTLIRVLPEWEGSHEIGIYAVHHGGDAASAAVTAFVDFLREQLDPPPWGPDEARVRAEG